MELLTKSIDALAENSGAKKKDESLLKHNSSESLEQISDFASTLRYLGMFAGNAIGAGLSSTLYFENKDREYLIPCAVVFGAGVIYSVIQYARSFKIEEKHDKEYINNSQNKE